LAAGARGTDLIAVEGELPVDSPGPQDYEWDCCPVGFDGRGGSGLV